MKKNVSKIDKLFRILIAVALMYLYSAGIISGGWGVVAIIAAIILVATSLFGRCPIYSILGVSTCPLKKAE